MVGPPPDSAVLGDRTMASKTSSHRETLPTTPPEAWEPLLRFARFAGRPLESFLRIEAASGVLLLVIAAIALIWSNSRWADSYEALWHTPIGLRVGSFAFERPLEWVVNDGLMVIFFFVVGLEIRREIHHGELSEWRRAALPAAAALGGMIVPALLYVAFAGGPATRAGWAVPMATDIAFAVGILTVLGRRVPPALRVLLLALAVIDDLGAIVVIALFYSTGISATGLVVALAGLLAILLMQRLGLRSKLLYVLPGLVVWGGVYAAGIHPTIAGVILGLLTPIRAWLGPDGFMEGIRMELEHLSAASSAELSSESLGETLKHVDVARREAMSPAESLISTLHPWVAFVIMPIFALANAGVSLGGDRSGGAGSTVVVAVAIGLVIGKPIGVLLACWAALKARVALLPVGLGPRHLVILGLVAGIGFTMSLFIAKLAFADPALLAAAKIGILAASASAAVVSIVMGRVFLSDAALAGGAKTADEAEASTEH
jgi:Na+:H+ antiporter, NhaA family